MTFRTGIGVSLIASALALALLLTVTRKGASIVPPPSNLSVGCHNFEAIAKWNYVGDSPLMHFKVQIEKDIKDEDNGDEDLQAIYTQQHHYDLSSLITVDNNYRLRVKAINGSLESHYVNSSEFSYNKFMPTEVRCSLEFPPVNLSRRDGQMAVRFIHPFHMYKHSSILRHLEKDAPKQYSRYKAFEYGIVVEGVTNTFECHAEDTVCEATFSVLEAIEVYCVTLEGMLKDTIVRNSEAICKHEEDKSCCSFFALPAVVCAVLIAAVLLVAVLTLFFKLTKAPAALTKTIASAISNQRSEWTIVQVEQVSMSTLHCVQPCVSPVLQTYEEVLQVETTASSVALCFQIGQEHLNESSGDQDLVDVQNVLDSSCSLGEYDSKPWDAEVDSVSSMPRPYDCPHVNAHIEMSPGDMVVGYRDTTT